MSFSLEAVFGVDTTGVTAGMKSARRALNNFVSDYAKLGAGVAVGVFVGLAKAAIDLGGKLSDTASNIGINVESLQALEAQHKRNGVSQEQLTKALEKTKAAVIASADGDAKATEALDRLGLKASALLRLPLDQQYEAIAKAAASATDQNQAYAAVTAILGEKVGPKLMGSLRELAQEGLPGVVKSATEAGQVLSTETIASLDRAGDAIDDFKKRATVAVGNILVNFESYEAFTLLSIKFQKVLAEFGGRMIDVFVEGGEMAYAILKGSFIGALNYLQDGFVGVIEGIAGLINKVLPAKFEINVGNLEAFRSGGQGIADEIARAIAQTSPSTFKKDFGGTWDEVLQKQQALVDNMRKVDLKPASDNLRLAGEAVKTSVSQGADKFSTSVPAALDGFFADLDQASTTMKHAGEETAKPIIEAAKAVAAEVRSMVGVIAGIRGGNTFNDATDSALAATVARNRAQAADLRNPATAAARGITYTGGLFGAPNMEAARLEAEAQNAQNEINLRAGIRSAYARGGTAGVYAQFSGRDPLVLDKLIDQFAKNLPQAERTTHAIETIASGLQRAGFLD